MTALLATSEHGDAMRSVVSRVRTVLTGVGLALIPVLWTAAGSAFAQILNADDVTAALIVAAGAAVSAAIGMVVMRRRRSSPVAGFGMPRNGRAVWWGLPLVATVLMAVVTQGLHVAGAVIAAYAVLVCAVAVNEEVWFRGIILAMLRRGGMRLAVVASAILFAVLHLANLAGGADAPAALLQVVFALLFGVVAAEVAILTTSLWPVIAWHAAWDFANFVGGNATTAVALAGIAGACLVMLAVATVLWRRLFRASVAS
ncbi:CPBP family intramembrane glutamic endopeptidase [Tersicoccus sp. MR15.9]|uniref:CPBP family intramembrane glutamic endopeptidase n=1 Tax=Tersicoccus mangrovi TaxID=3121635 RepID=UPI002FE58B90